MISVIRVNCINQKIGSYTNVVVNFLSISYLSSEQIRTLSTLQEFIVIRFTFYIDYIYIYIYYIYMYNMYIIFIHYIYMYI